MLNMKIMVALPLQVSEVCEAPVVIRLDGSALQGQQELPIEIFETGRGRLQYSSFLFLQYP
jgi:hypothetical protein